MNKLRNRSGTDVTEIQLGAAMNESARYIKIVEWSDEDQYFVGQCPGIIGPCCHGTDEAQVYAELCLIVDEWIETLKKDRKPLPPPTAGKDLEKKLSDAA